jgi:hypothetical protein
MNNKVTFFNREIVFGTYFIGQWIDVVGANDVQESFMVLQKNPFKYIPLFIATGINTSAELYGLEKVTLLDVTNEIDECGGIASDEVQNVLKVFTTSLEVALGKNKAGAKPKPRKN